MVTDVSDVKIEMAVNVFVFTLFISLDKTGSGENVSFLRTETVRCRQHTTEQTSSFVYLLYTCDSKALT